MKQILTKEKKDNLMKELKRLEDFMMTAQDNHDILDVYFPHTLYEVKSIMEIVIWKEVEYKDTEFGTKIK